MLSPGVAAFRLRLIPPLARPPEEIEVIVTGSSIRDEGADTADAMRQMAKMWTQKR